MKNKIRLILWIVLTVAAVAVFVYNLANGRTHTYLASVVGVGFTGLLLAAEIMRIRNEAE